MTAGPAQVPVPGGIGGVTVRLLSVRPLVYQIDGFLAGCQPGTPGNARLGIENECELLVELATESGGLAESTQHITANASSLGRGGARDKDWRDSASVWLRKAGGLRTHPLLAEINQRVAAVAGLPLAAVEAGSGVQVVRYAEGQHYWPHFDSRHLTNLGPPAGNDPQSYPAAARLATVRRAAHNTRPCSSAPNS